MYFNLIGPGRVGLALAHALIHTGQYTLLSLYHPQLASAKQASQMLGQGTPIDDLKVIAKADITFITTQDSNIESITFELTQAKSLKPNSTIAHMSGLLSSDILAPLKTQNVYIGSLHPLKAFCQKDSPEENAFQQINCAVEGEEIAVTQLTKIAHDLNAVVFKINPKNKDTYHAAAIMASNYLVTLAAEATHLFKNAGFLETDAHKLCTHLMQTSLNNLKKSGNAKKALTGPLVRGDTDTIQKHLNAIHSETTQSLYQTAGLATLPLTPLKEQALITLKALLTS